ncbi:MAG: hypothetical protein ISR58_06695 [Anaerolineales bacterium]|nr:hypothetical protein [Chloroflexota bacterium]MBL6980862.1 hypothetical protein [Anaerolineales bacterium]
MSPNTLRTVIAIVLFVHAVGHVQGVMASVGLSTLENWHPRSWLFDNLLGERASQTLAFVIWALCVLGFLATTFAFLGIGIPHGIWRTLAMIFAGLSAVGLIFYWNSLTALFNKIGAIGVNAGILIGLLMLNWPSESEIGF